MYYSLIYGLALAAMYGAFWLRAAGILPDELMVLAILAAAAVVWRLEAQAKCKRKKGTP